MGSDQHFCLRWNNFHSNIAASFEHLRDHEEFVDVTLACEGRSLKAHKIVLSACSPYFKNLLKQNPCQHPIIILRDVAFPDLSALLNFVYQGEVYVSQDRLPAFLRTAEMLHIKGLTDQNHQSSNSAHPTCPPVSIGPPSSTTIFQATHDQNVLCNKVSILGVPLTSPRSQTPPSPSSHSHHHHISPPPKKRRSATTITALPSGSPTTTSPPTPTSSSTPPRMELFSTSREDGLGPGHLDGSTLAAALMKPLSGSGRSEVIVTPSRPPLHLSSVHLHDTLKVKQEVEEISQNDIKEEGDEEVNQAVNLVTEGSILRQRIQGYRGSPDAPLPLSFNTGNGRLPPLSALSTSISHEDSASEDGFFGGGDTGGEGGGDDSEQEKEALAASPMVIRSPLGGILQREAPGLFGGAGTSGSLSHHDSSQDMVLNLSTGCSPKDTKKWPSRQPVNCQYCGVRISMAFNLRNHVKRCKMRPFTPTTGQSVRSASLPCVSQTHQQQSQSEEALEDSSFGSGGGDVSPLPQTLPQQILPVDPHQLLSSRGQNSALSRITTPSSSGISTHSSSTPISSLFTTASTSATTIHWGGQQ